MKRRISTGAFARAISTKLPVAISDDMVRGWCESGLLPAWRNPAHQDAWYFIHPDAEQIRKFLLNVLAFDEAYAREVLHRLGLNFNQLLLPLAISFEQLA